MDTFITSLYSIHHISVHTPSFLDTCKLGPCSLLHIHYPSPYLSSLATFLPALLLAPLSQPYAWKAQLTRSAHNIARQPTNSPCTIRRTRARSRPSLYFPRKRNKRGFPSIVCYFDVIAEPWLPVGTVYVPRRQFLHPTS